MLNMCKLRNRETGLAVAAITLTLLAGCSNKSGQPKPADKDATENRTEGQSSRSRGVAGQWESNWGPMTLEHGPIEGNKSVSVTGFWIQGEGKRGIVKSGPCGPATGKLDPIAEETWIGQRGPVQLTLSADGSVIDGSGKNIPSGELYDWKMVRKKAN